MTDDGLQGRQDRLAACVQSAARAALHGGAWSSEEVVRAGDDFFAAVAALPEETWEEGGLAGPATGMRLGAVRLVLDVYGLLSFAPVRELLPRWRERAAWLAAGTRLAPVVEKLDTPLFLEAQRLGWMTLVGEERATIEAAEASFLATCRDPVLLRYGLGG